MKKQEIIKKIYFYGKEEVKDIEKIINSYKERHPKISESNIMKNIIFNRFSQEQIIKKLNIQNKQILEEIKFSETYIRMLMEMVTHLFSKKDIPNKFLNLDPIKNSKMLFKNKKIEEIREKFYHKLSKDEHENKSK